MTLVKTKVKRILFLGNGPQTVSFMQIAKKLGYEVYNKARWCEKGKSYVDEDGNGFFQVIVADAHKAWITYVQSFPQAKFIFVKDRWTFHHQLSTLFFN